MFIPHFAIWFFLHSAFCILHFSEIRGSILFGCGWPHRAFPRQNQGLKKTSKKTVDKN